MRFFKYFCLLFFFSVTAKGQYSQERITLGSLKAFDFIAKGTTASGFNYQIEFKGNDNGDLIINCFATDLQNRPLADYMQFFSMSLKETNARFPKLSTPPEQRLKFFSQEGFLYFPMIENQAASKLDNLLIIELNKTGEMRISLHYGAPKGFDFTKGFTENDMSKAPIPQLGSIVMTTDWIEVPR